MTKKGQIYIDKFSFKEITDEQLQKKSTQRLLQILKRLRSRQSCIPASITDYWCGEKDCNCGWLGGDEEWDNDVQPVIDYFESRINFIKSILATR